MRALLMALLLVLLPHAAAQGHDHAAGSGFAVVTDLGHDGLAHVGSPVHFSVIVFGDDAVPDFHQDVPVRVSLDNVTLYETTTVSGHDYDGVHGFDIVFPKAGTWRVEALADDKVVAYLEGRATVVAHRNATIHATLVGEPPMLVVAVQDDGEIMPHTDVLVEYLGGGETVLRTKLHMHDKPAAMKLGALGDVTSLRLTAFTAAPDQAATIRPITLEMPATSTDGPPAPAMPSANPERNAVTISAGTRTLVGTYDPYTSVGPGTLQHLTAMVVDGDGMPLRHMTFEATFSGPQGIILSTVSHASYDGQFHEHDGIFELAARRATPGNYVLDIKAIRGNWSDSIQMVYTVAPPGLPTLAGPQLVSMQAAAFQADMPGSLTFHIADIAGRPFAHGEIEAEVRDATGLVILRDKWHTHGGGEFPVTINFPDGGTYPLGIDPFPLDPQPVGPYYRDSFGTPLAFAVSVAGDPLPPGVATGGNEPLTYFEAKLSKEPAGEATPLPVVLLLLALALVAARKR